MSERHGPARKPAAPAVAFIATVTLGVGTGIAANFPQHLTDVYLTPQIKTGARIETIFSKTVAITGTGFEPLVRRVSGSASDTILATGPYGLKDDSHYIYDGLASGSGVIVIRGDGIHYCDTQGRCSENNQTSAPIFDPMLWGQVPTDLAVGRSWTVDVKSPWEIGPTGTEEVSVLRLDRSLGLITLARHGKGRGMSSDDIRRHDFTITAHGHEIKVQLHPGPAVWQGRATFLHGLTIVDEIVLTRPVKLVSNSRHTFRGEERIYTIFAES